MCCTQDMGTQGKHGEQGCCSLLHLSVPTWVGQDGNKEIPCPSWSRGAASVHGAMRRRQTDRGAAPLPAHLSHTLGKISHPFLPGAIHQCLWDKREDLSKLCLLSPLHFPPAASTFSLGGHKIKAAFGF